MNVNIPFYLFQVVGYQELINHKICIYSSGKNLIFFHYKPALGFLVYLNKVFQLYYPTESLWRKCSETIIKFLGRRYTFFFFKSAWTTDSLNKIISGTYFTKQKKKFACKLCTVKVKWIRSYPFLSLWHFFQTLR